MPVAKRGKQAPPKAAKKKSTKKKPLKKAASKKSVKKKRVIRPSKKTSAKKKVAIKKKIVAKKKVAIKKKVAAKKKGAAKKKVVAKKKGKAKKKAVASDQSVNSWTAPVREPNPAAYRLYEEGLSLLHRKKNAQARDRLNQVIKKFSYEVEVSARARSLLKVCEKRLKAEKKTPVTAEGLFNRGVLRHNDRRYDEALDHFSQALKLTRKNNDHIYYALAATEASAGDLDSALKHLRKAIEIREKNRFFASNDPDFRLLLSNQKFKELVHPE